MFFFCFAEKIKARQAELDSIVSGGQSQEEPMDDSVGGGEGMEVDRGRGGRGRSDSGEASD